MTNLTSEQYRDVIRHLPNVTEEVPNIQQLLRRAVQTFYKKFRAYPELAGVAPGNVAIFGDQLQFNNGIVLPVATQMATMVVGRRVPGKRFTIATSTDVGKPHKVSFSFSRNRPLAPGCPKWLNYIKGVIDAFGDTVPPFEAVFESTFPKGGGFGTVPSLEVAFYTFLEILVGKKTDPIEKAKALQRAEEKFGNQKFGLVGRITSILARDREFMVVDCITNEVLDIPFRNTDAELIVVDAHLNLEEYDQHEFSHMDKYLEKVCEILGVQSLRHCDEEIETIENKLNDILESVKKKEEEEEEEEEEEVTGSDEWTAEDYRIMIRKTRYYLLELRRIDEAIQAWNDGDLQTFGETMIESHQSLVNDFGFENPVFNFLVEASLEVEGVLGSKVTGTGLGSGVVTIVKKSKTQKYCNYIREKFLQNQDQLAAELRELLQRKKQEQHEMKKSFASKFSNAVDPNRIADGNLESDAKKANRGEKERICMEVKEVPCIEKVVKQGRCGTWTHFQEVPKKEELGRQKPVKEVNSQTVSEEGEFFEVMSTVSEVQMPELDEPSFYRISPFPGARMMFVTKPDLLRSFYAAPIPHPKVLVKAAIQEFKETYGGKIEAISLSPGSVVVFGDFMEFHLGCIVLMALPMYVVTVGGRNDSVFFSVKTTLEKLQGQNVLRCPIPCVRSLESETQLWAGHVVGLVNDFRRSVPGFNAVVHSSVPPDLGLHSRAAMHSSIYTFLENLTGDVAEGPLERIDRCHRSEMDVSPDDLELIDNCTSIKYFATFLSKEGHLTILDCKKSKISNYFFDDPSYVFLIACCTKNDTSLTLKSLEERLKHCRDAIDIVGRDSLLNLDLKHLKCLKKKGASEEMIKRARYVITEHQRTLDAIKAIQAEDYERVGLLMSQSHKSLRDDYEVSSPQIEELYRLSMSAEGVLGAKLLGRGFNATIMILVGLSDAENCIRYIRKNYTDKTDKPVFYITKPAGGVFSMDPNVDVPYIL